MSSGREGIGRGRGRGVRRENQGPERRDVRRSTEPVVDEKQFQEAVDSSNESPSKGATNTCQPTVLSSDAASAEPDVCKTSTLSVFAEEFYPKGYVQSQDHRYQNSSGSSEDLASAKSRMCELMTNLTRNPGDFDQSLTPLKDTFTVWLQDPRIVHSIIDAIIEQSVTETNFRYNGARLCSFLYNASNSVNCSEFPRYLIERCSAISPTIEPQRLHGLAIFLAELFIQLEAAQGTGQRIGALGEQLFVILEMLVSQAITANAEAQQQGTQASVMAAENKGENLKCVCQALKLAGWHLEEMFRQRTIQLTNDLARAAGGAAGEKGVRRMASSVVDLRHSCWGRSNSTIADFSPSTVCHNADSAPYHPHSGSWQGGGGGRGRGHRHFHSNLDEPVFYGPDGQILTAEESRFLQDSIAAICDEEECGDGEWGDNWSDGGGMDEEMEAAFEQFLQLGQKSTTA